MKTTAWLQTFFGLLMLFLTLVVSCARNTSAVNPLGGLVTPTYTTTPWPTSTNTTTPSPTPSVFFDWDDFNCTSAWTTFATNPGSAQSNPTMGGSPAAVATCSIESTSPNQNYYEPSYFSINVTNWGAGTGANQGTVRCTFPCYEPYNWDNYTGTLNTCTTQYNGTGNTDVTRGTSGITGSFLPTKLSFWFCVPSGPATVQQVYLLDGAGNEAEATFSSLSIYYQGQLEQITIPVNSSAAWSTVAGSGMGSPGSGVGILGDTGSNGGGWTKMTSISFVMNGQYSPPFNVGALMGIGNIYFY